MYELDVGLRVLPVLAEITLVTHPTDFILNDTILSFNRTAVSSFFMLNPQLQMASNELTSSKEYF